MKNVIIFLFPLFLLMISGCKTDKKYHDVTKVEKVVSEAAIQDVLEFQKSMDAQFKNPETSPLPDRYRKDFEGLDFFAPDTTYIVQAKLVRTPDSLPFQMPTNTDRKSIEVVYGIAHFTLQGKTHQLEIYQNKELMLTAGYEDYLFLPFTDLTNGNETYGGGRYIDLSIPKSDTIIIDFNKAYNPNCAYNKKYSCPLVPAVNDLTIEVRAGVKAFEKGYK